MTADEAVAYALAGAQPFETLDTPGGAVPGTGAGEPAQPARAGGGGADRAGPDELRDCPRGAHRQRKNSRRACRPHPPKAGRTLPCRDRRLGRRGRASPTMRHERRAGRRT